MTVENGPAIHSDFRLFERDDKASDDHGAGAEIRDILRLAWRLPLDTYVTLDLPVLLTLLSLPEERSARSCTSGQAVDGSGESRGRGSKGDARAFHASTDLKRL